MRFDQPPTHGCENCGAFAGKPEEVLRRRLHRDDGEWLCDDCLADKEEREELEELDDLDEDIY